MNPFELYYQWWKWWMETLFEVKALRECRNIDVSRIDRIEKALIGDGLL
jgi:hypothetical protein